MKNTPRGVYIHIPFCKYICSYCDFNKFFIQRQPVDKYIDCLIKEIETIEQVSDIETIYIDSILKHADFSLGDLPEFLDRLSAISNNYGMNFVVSLSAEKEEMIGVDFANYELLN